MSGICLGPGLARRPKRRRPHVQCTVPYSAGSSSKRYIYCANRSIYMVVSYSRLSMRDPKW